MKYIPNIPKMSMPTISVIGYLPPKVEDTLAKDEQARQQREDLLHRQKWNTFFGGVKQIFMFVSGPLIGAGLGLIIASFTGVVPDVADGATVKEVAEKTAELATKMYAGLGLIAGAGVATAVAVGANHLSAQYYHAAAYDQLEINAQHTAKYTGKAIRRELEDMQQQEEAQLVIFDNPDAQRADGKPWTQHLDEQALAANQNRER